MTTIERVEATAVRVPLADPPSFAGREVPAREYTLVRITDAEGLQGVGFLHAGALGARLGSLAVRELLAPLLVGADPTETEALWARMYQGTLLHGRLGIVLRAISAVDQALWDRNARAVGLPLWRYLGGATTGSVPLYASGGYYLPGKGPEGLADEVAGYVSRGFRAVKIKVGRGPIEEDQARVAAAREAIGDAVELMLDANNAWSDLLTALDAMRRFEPYRPAWIEEPFGPDDIANHVRLARRTAVPVATGEIEGPRWRHEDLLAADGIAVLQTDAGVCGGVTEFRRIAAMASSRGVSICPHAFHHLHVHLAASTPNARYVEYFTDTEVVNFPDLVDWQPEVVDGRMLLPERPGFGYDFLEEVVERHQLEPWG
jgi:L-alanine-DL-glutamate epimerase-like enolase superfamily enzyme